MSTLPDRCSIKWIFSLNPHRLLIDLWDVTLTGPALTVPGNDTWVQSIRVSQFDPQTIRLVLDIKEPRNCVVGIDETNPARLLIKTMTELQEATWLPDGNGGRLILKGSGRLPGEPRYDQNTGKLYIRIPRPSWGRSCRLRRTRTLSSNSGSWNHPPWKWN